MKREQVLRVGILLWLMVVWILLWGNISFGNIFGGLAVGLIIMVLLPLPRVPVEGRVHLLSILRLLWMIVYYAIQSSIQVAWLAIRPSPPSRRASRRRSTASKSSPRISRTPRTTRRAS